MTSRSLEQVAAAVRSLHLTVAALRIEQLHRGGLSGPELDHVAAAELVAIIEVLIDYLEGQQ